MSRKDSAQAAALSRALRKAGWRPVGSDNPRSWEAGLMIRAGSLGLGATLVVRSHSPRRLKEWADGLAAGLSELGYGFERSEESGDEPDVWFRRVKKIDTKES